MVNLWLARVTAVLLPPAFCAAWVPFRDNTQNTNAALVLVIVIVAISTTGDRVAGVIAAVSAGAWFDFFLTEPYETFSVEDRHDIETGLLLLAVGVVVTEIALWGRRQHALAGETAGYLAGLHDASQTAAVGGGSPSVLIDRVCAQMVKILGLTGCRFDYGTGLGNARLRHDGRVTRGAAVVDVDTRGLPTEVETELLVESGGSFRGRFLMTAPPRCRPTLEQRIVAASLADQVGAALTEYSLRRPDEP
jgi:uncharacterized protein DUF4118